MTKKIIIIALLLASATTIAKGQSATFTDINPDGRSAAMGNAGYAVEANAFSIFNNTAAIAFENNAWQAGYSFNLYQPDAKAYNGMHTIGGYYRIAKKHSVAVGFNYLAYKKIDIVDATGTKTGDYMNHDMAISAGYAYRINDIFSIAANVRFIQSKQGDTAAAANYEDGTAFAGDLSFMYRQNGLSASVGAYNIGSKIDYGYYKNDLSSHIKAGVAYEWNINYTHYITGTAQGSYLLKADERINVDGTTEDAQKIFAGVGAEYSYKKLYSARLGYRIGDKETSYFTAGVGVCVGPVTLDFAYLIGSKDTLLRNTMLIGVSVDF